MTDAENLRRRASAAPAAIDTDDFNEAFVRALKADFAAHGDSAIAAMRDEKPVEYVKIVAALCTKDAGNATDRLRQMSDVELARHVEEVAARAGYEIRRAASSATRSGEGPPVASAAGTDAAG